MDPHQLIGAVVGGVVGILLLSVVSVDGQKDCNKRNLIVDLAVSPVGSRQEEEAG